MLDSPDEMSITSLSMGFGESWGAGVSLKDPLQLEMIGDDGRDKVLSLSDCFTFCLLMHVTLAYGFLEDLSIVLLVCLSLDGDVIGDKGAVFDVECSGLSKTLVCMPENLFRFLGRSALSLSTRLESIFLVGVGP